MNDRELLELAAKAAGIDIEWVKDDPAYSYLYIGDLPSIRNRNERDKARWKTWSPLTNDGDALRLAVKLALDMYIHDRDTSVVTGNLASALEHHGTDPCAATRRAIVRAAAEVGQGIA